MGQRQYIESEEAKRRIIEYCLHKGVLAGWSGRSESAGACCAARPPAESPDAAGNVYITGRVTG
ncbi:MAG: hypothetical protein CFH36_00797 [Alphaproteobacteria bacterium MarineAlpha9_Bin6]|nr:MAG: hypothetical protein CFH36_00797 [Alphaproteobacteria bacterium MarineAlpha9_Bin6]